MGLRIQFQGGEFAGKVLNFDDQVATIAFGRDPAKCQVVFPADETKVRREHCALQLVLGRYRLQVNKNTLVLLDGKPAKEGQQLGDTAELQLGPDGPQLIVTTTASAGLPPTEDQGAQPSPLTVMEELKGRAKTGRKIALATGVLVLLLGGIVWVHHRHLNQLDERQAILMNELKPQSDTLRAALEEARPSVYMVLLRFQKEGEANVEEVTLGTAWVAGDGVLATNAHVAGMCGNIGKPVAEYSDYGVLKECVVRSNAPEPKTLRIISAVIHPGYDAFRTIWANFKPGYGKSLQTLRIVNPAGPACDVGLLRVDEADKAELAGKLSIATPKELDDLPAGRQVGYVGYPCEGLALINQTHPSPAFYFGSITAITDFLGVSSKDGQLIQNSLQVVGGASGSPVLNADGKVVAIISAGNMVKTSEGARIPMGMNFAQRVDLVAELLEGRAENVQAARSAEWAAQIPKEYDTRFVRLVVQYLNDEKGRLAGGEEDVEIAEKDVAHQAGKLSASSDAASPAAYKVTASLPLNAVCLVAAISSDASCDLALNVVEMGGARAGVEHAGTKILPGVPCACATRFEPGGGEPVEITASATSAGAPVDVYLYQLERKEPTAEKRLGKVVAAWQKGTEESGGSRSAERVITRQAELGEPTTELAMPFYKMELDIPAAGQYLVAAVGSAGERVGILVNGVNISGWAPLAKDLCAPPCTAYSFGAPGKEKAAIYIAGNSSKTRFDLWVYRAVPATP